MRRPRGNRSPAEAEKLGEREQRTLCRRHVLGLATAGGGKGRPASHSMAGLFAASPQ